ncbi:MAG: hypothetical protein BWX71_02821 [Deltaproteobacteria bacterium ADurb.Bin072]|nr:MAG: hypothetical protein BWX71_02821 [Deltaproteobacteria bacterium ADurb.Bin072]
MRARSLTGTDPVSRQALTPCAHMALKSSSQWETRSEMTSAMPLSVSPARAATSSTMRRLRFASATSAEIMYWYSSASKKKAQFVWRTMSLARMIRFMAWSSVGLISWTLSPR